MATGFIHVDELPLISEEDTEWQDAEWEHVSNIQHKQQNDNEPSRYSSLIEEEDDDDDDEEMEEVGVKGVADIDYTPQKHGCIELQKGEQIF